MPLYTPMTVVGTSDFSALRAQFKQLNTAHFPGDVLYPLEEVAWLASPSYFFAGVLDDAGRLVSYANVLLISPAEYNDFCAGKIAEEKLQGGNLFESAAYLYLISLIVDKECHTPYLYRTLFKELAAWTREHHTAITHLFSVPTNAKATDILAKATFSEVARYHDYPIMMLERQKSLLVNSLLPPQPSRHTRQPF